MRGTLALSWGSYGGFYWFSGYTARLVLGWVAFTYIPEDLDELLVVRTVENEKIGKRRSFKSNL